MSPMRHQQRFVFCFALVLGSSLPWGLWAQEADGGTQSPFVFGLEARSFSLGNAAVAYPQGASSLIWNPAGMVVVDQRVAAFSMSTLFTGTQYHYAGIILPTLEAGTFGLGLSRIGTDGIPRTEWDQNTIDFQGDMSYWWGRLNLGYGLRIFRGLSLGVGFEVDRMVLGTWSTNGFAFHGGLHYAFGSQGGILKGLYLGATVEDLISPQLSLGSSVQRIPYTMRLGLAKVFTLGGGGHVLVLADLEQPELAASRYHMGLELAFGTMLFVRGGLNNGQMALGAGLRYGDFSLDYATGQLNDLGILPWTHRFSLSFHMGATLSEKRAQIDAAKQREVEQRFQARVEAERRRRIEDGLRAARDYLDKSDYFNARLELGTVLMEDPEHAEAKAIMDEVVAKETAYQAEREQALLNEERERSERQRDVQYIRQRRTEANEALEKGDVRGAIEAWELALARDPNDEVLRNNLNQARTRLESLITDLIAEARRLTRQEAISEAYKRLELAKQQAQGNETLLSRVNQEIRTLDREVDFLNNYQKGTRLFQKQDYAGAQPYLDRALQLKPEHEQAKEMASICRAVIRGGSQKMDERVRDKYIQGMQLYRNGNYREALKAWEEGLQLDPNNIALLRAIRSVREKIQDLEQ